MNVAKIAFGFPAGLVLVVLAALASPAFDWSGTWTGSIDTGGMGVDTVILVLKRADKTYTGTIDDSLALIEKNTTISEVKLDGDELSFSFKAVGGSMDFMMKLSVNGGKTSAQLANKAIGEWGDFESFSRK